MPVQPPRTAVQTFLWRALRTSLLILLAAVLIFWFFSRRTLLELSNYLFMGGTISIVVGLILLAGGWGSTESISEREASPAATRRERARLTLLEVLSLYDLTIQVWFAGVLLILASILVGQLI